MGWNLAWTVVYCRELYHFFHMNPLMAICCPATSFLHRSARWLVYLHGRMESSCCTKRISFNLVQSICTFSEPLPRWVLPSTQSTEYSLKGHLSYQPASPSLHLPQGIHVLNKGLHQFAVVSCRASISKGTRFGPYRGRVVQPSQVKEGEDNAYLWEVRIIQIQMAKCCQWLRL